MDDLPNLPGTAAPKPFTRPTVEDAFDYDVAFKVALIGVGEGGGRIAETFWKQGYRRVCAVNTAQQDLQGLEDSILKLDLRANGAGQDMEKGQRLISAASGEIWDLLLRAIPDNPDYLLVCASLGGGTGSGGVVPVLNLCRRFMQERGLSDKRVGAVVSLPNPYEGQRTARNAVTAFNKLHALGPSPLIVIDNQRIEKLYQVGATKLFGCCNEQVVKMFHLFNQLAARRSRLVTFDRADCASLLDNGLICFGASPVTNYESQADITSCIREQLAATVLADVDLTTGDKAGCIFVGGEDLLEQIPMDHLGAAFTSLTRQLRDDSVIYRGIYVGKSPDLRCYSLISGLARPENRLKHLAACGGLQTTEGESRLGV